MAVSPPSFLLVSAGVCAVRFPFSVCFSSAVFVLSKLSRVCIAAYVVLLMLFVYIVKETDRRMKVVLLCLEETALTGIGNMYI